MLNGATQIIAGVSTTILDPFRLVEAVTRGTSVILVIAAAPSGGDLSRGGERHSFALLSDGPSIVECLSFTEAGRSRVRVEAVREAVARSLETSKMGITVFLVPDLLLEQYRRVLDLNPCLKVQIDRLSQEELSRMLASTECRTGILERYQYHDGMPCVDLKEYTAGDPVPESFTQGRLLLYELDQSPAFLPKPSSLPPHNEEGGGGAPAVCVAGRSGDPFTGAPPPERELDNAAVDTEKVMLLVQGILARAPSAARSTRPGWRGSPRRAVLKIPRRGQTTPPPAVVPVTQPEPITGADEPSDPLPTAVPDRPGPKFNRDSEAPADSLTKLASKDDYTKIFDKVLRSFRRKAFESLGSRQEETFKKAEQSVRFLLPEFDPQNLSPDTASTVLDVIDAVIKDVPFLRRSKLREAALILIADLYDKHYELLEAHNAIDKLEQLYYRLKS
jgi:hypothetical protein